VSVDGARLNNNALLSGQSAIQERMAAFELQLCLGGSQGLIKPVAGSNPARRHIQQYILFGLMFCDFQQMAVFIKHMGTSLTNSSMVTLI
jgi:hypothetical protein